MSKLNSNPNQDALSRAIERANDRKPLATAEEVINMLTKQTKSKDIVPNSKPKKRRKVSSAKQKIEHVPEIDHLEHIPEIPNGFPKGTVLNNDGSLSLPDGRRIRKIKQEVDHE